MVQAVAALMSLMLGNWQITFDETDAKLELANDKGEVRVSGSLGFSSGGKAWRVVAPRDAAKNRLSLLDDKGNVQG